MAVAAGNIVADDVVAVVLGVGMGVVTAVTAVIVLIILEVGKGVVVVVLVQVAMLGAVIVVPVGLV